MKSIFTIFLFVLYCSVQSADAAIRTFQFNGTITTSSIGGFPVGTPFVATLSYDDAQGSTGAGSTYAYYSSFSFTLTLTGLDFTTDPVTDILYVQHGSFPGPGPIQNLADQLIYYSVSGCGTSIDLSLVNFAGSLFSSTSLPSSLSLADFDGATVRYYTNACDPFSTHWDGTITSITSCTTDPIVTTNADAGPGSLRQAIIDACPGSTITFDMNQVISPISLSNGQIVIDKNLNIQGPGAILTVQNTMAQSSISRVFNINAGVTAAISNLTISGGNCTGDGINGGGILNKGIFTVTNSTISGNTSTSSGGGIANEGGSVDITNSTIIGNTSPVGGGLISTGIVNLINSTVSGNTATLVGGGIHVNGNNAIVNVTNSTISGNIAPSGGGIYPNVGTVNLINSTISSNQATNGSGGGITNFSTVNSKNSIIAGNTASAAGPDFSGTLISQGYNLIGNTTGTTITGITTGNILNQNPSLGSLANNGGPTQTHALLPGSPAINVGNNTGAPLTDQRSITRPQQSTTDIGAFESQGFNITVSSGNNQSTVVNSTFANPLGVTVTSSFNEPVNGGIVTFSPPTSGASSTIAGNPATITNGSATTGVVTANGNVGGPYTVTASTTGASVSFSLSNNVLCVTNPVVTSNADAGPGTLRQAIIDACPGSTITFAPALNGQTITLASTLPAIDKGLTITGPGANLLSISGNNSSRVFVVDEGATVTFNNITVTKGYFTDVFGGPGGGIYNRGTLVINNSILSNNSAEGAGGGVYSVGKLDLTNSTISGNTGHVGGGIYNASERTITITNSTISDNSATNGAGGGIYNGSSNNNLIVINSTIVNNKTVGGGGGIISNGTVTITNTTISNNSAGAVSGGGLLNVAGVGTMNLLNTIVAGNKSADVTGADFLGPVTSQGNNLIGKSDGSSGWVPSDFTGTNASPLNPLLGALANNGGPTLTHALLPGSPAINGGTNTGAPVTDQRGITRPQQTTTDIGAFESQGFNMTISGGSNQSTIINTAFANPLAVTITSSFNEPVDGGIVTFIPPASGSSSTIAGNPATITNGSATTGVVTANGIAGGYSVTASTGATSISFSLTNTTGCTISCPANITVNNSTGKCGAYVSYTAATTTGNCGTLSYSIKSGAWFPVGTTPVTVTSTTGGTCTFNVIVMDVQKPTIVCPSDITVNATSNSCSKAVTFNLTVTDNCPGATVTTSLASGSLFNVGTTTVTATATDASGNKSISTFKVKVKESQAPVIKTVATPIVLLWPANGSYQTINVSQFVLSVTDNCSSIPVSNVKITKVTSDEADNASGNNDGNTTKDIKIASDCKSVDLRRERNSKGNGRVYTIYLSVTDAGGNTGTASFKVIAPISQGSTTAVDNGSACTVSSYCSGNNHRPGAATTDDEEVIVKNDIPEGFMMEQNYPNPFSAVTTIRYAIPVEAKVSLGVYNQVGQIVAQLTEGKMSAGNHQASFDATKLTAGIYLYRLLAVDADGKPVVLTKKMIVAK